MKNNKETLEFFTFLRQNKQGISCDSRTLKRGEVFFALSGTATSGKAYLEEAIGKGASACVVEGEKEGVSSLGIPVFQVANARETLAKAAALLWPRAPAVCVAVTGTNGKSSTVSFLQQIWEKQGRKAATLGTLGVLGAGSVQSLNHTTPDPILLHQTLDHLAQEGVTHLALEASSHGLLQRRLDGMSLKVAGFTQLTRDHLDYHPTLEAYFAAKCRLFDELLPQDGKVTLWPEEPFADQVLQHVLARGLEVLTIGYEKSCDLQILENRLVGFSHHLRLKTKEETFEVILPLPGLFQCKNALLAAGLAFQSGENMAGVLSVLPNLKGVLGRFEKVGETQKGAFVFIDYAHTPDALRRVLEALRAYVGEGKKLSVVFGCGGERDRGKRPQMGRIATLLADRVYVTDDNPRGEDPSFIRQEILAGDTHAVEIADRREAIFQALSDLAQGDILVIAGKGHETGQAIGGVTLPFSDHAVVKEYLEGDF